MGMWNEYCTICGGPTYVLFNDMDAETVKGKPLTPPAPNLADYTWLESCIGISNKEELIPLTSYNFYGTFDIQSNPSSPYSYFSIGCRDKDYLDETATRGYACHVTYSNLLQQELNYTLKYADLLTLQVDDEYDYNRFSWSDYGGLAKYQGRFFLVEQLVKDGKLWMIENLSRDVQNKERILQLWRPLVESGFKRPDAIVGDTGSLAWEIAKLNLDESKV